MAQIIVNLKYYKIYVKNPDGKLGQYKTAKFSDFVELKSKLEKDKTNEIEYTR
jgi:hypothetical protein